MLAAISMVCVACTSDQTDQATVTTTQPDASETRLASGATISNGQPIQIEIGTLCRDRNGGGVRARVSLREPADGMYFAISHSYPNDMAGRTIRLWIPDSAPAGNYKLDVNCGHSDVLESMLSTTLTKTDLPVPTPPGPDMVAVEGRTLTAVGTGELFDGSSYVIQAWLELADDEGNVSARATLGPRSDPRLELRIEVPDYIDGGSYQAGLATVPIVSEFQTFPVELATPTTTE
ncbi:MAG: hypothetical protein R2770_12590 [Acidimicrobiales bacterium]